MSESFGPSMHNLFSLIFAGTTNYNYWNIVPIILLILLSAFFSASETALTRVNKVKIKILADDGSKKARKALTIIDKYDKTLTTLLVGNNLVNIAIATLSLRLFMNFIETQSTADLVSTLVTTLVLLIFGEILPKSFANSHAEKITLFVSYVLYGLNIILTPITIVFILLKKLFKTKTEENNVTEDELEVILDNMEESGNIDEGENDLIQSVLELNDKTAGDIMTPRVEIVAINVEDDIEHIKKVFFENQFSRIPVYENDKDNIIGILYERDFFTKLIKRQKISIKSLMKPVKYVSKEMKVDTLIDEFQAEQVHLAIVVDEFGGTDGLVTMEDALEELVGEIYDEHDEVEKNPFIKTSENHYHLDADIDIEDLFEELNIDALPDTSYPKLGGWLLELSSELPEVGQRISYECSYSSFDEEEEEYVNYHKRLWFTITEVEDHRILSCDLEVLDVENEEEETNEEEHEE